MSKLKTAYKTFRENKRLFRIALFTDLNKNGLLNWMSDKSFLKLLYKVHFGRRLDLVTPKSFNEKLQWLKMYDRNPQYCMLVDKYEVKQYVANVIGEDYIIPTLGVWDSVEEVDWQSLPNQFVIKCTHDSGSVVVCKNKNDLDIDAVSKKLKKCLKKNMYYWGREWVYRDVKPRIIAEKFMKDEKPELTDYKFMCFDGKVKCAFLCTNRFSEGGLKVTFYDTEWNKMPFERQHPSESIPAPKPQSYNEMVALSEKLATGIPFVRVDFYEINGRPYFGEMTFFPGDGTEAFTPEEWDYKLGEWIVLPKKSS
jgi:hypothetical protein